MGTVIDVILVLVLVGAVVGGLARGLFASVGALLGFVAGGVAAWWLLPLVNGWIGVLGVWPQLRVVLVLAALAAVVSIGGALGAAVGRALGRGVKRIKLGALDRLAGGVLSLAVAALAITLIGGGLAGAGVPVLSPAVSSSVVVRTIERFTPQPLARALAEVRAGVLAEGLPAFGQLLDGAVAAPASPPIALDDPALSRAAQSVARISGTAYACASQSTGSGFVIAQDRVLTNAHVVAGVDAPIVELPGRAAVQGRVVAFDASADLAVVAADGLGAAPLSLGDELAPGASAVVQGYPYGGPFTSGGASVRSVGETLVPDIYDASRVPREIYALNAVVRPGNSGGPVLDAQGRAVGIVFARADDGTDVGYASTRDAIAALVAAAPGASAPVSTGDCLRD